MYARSCAQCYTSTWIKICRQHAHGYMAILHVYTQSHAYKFTAIFHQESAVSAIPMNHELTVSISTSLSLLSWTLPHQQHLRVIHNLKFCWLRGVNSTAEILLSGLNDTTKQSGPGHPLNRGFLSSLQGEGVGDLAGCTEGNNGIADTQAERCSANKFC